MKALALVFVVAAAFVTGCATNAPLPPKAVALNDEGAKALAADDLEHAEAQIALALEYNPRFTEAWVNLGLVELRRGRLDAAERDFRKAEELNPDLPAPFQALGLLEERRGRLDKAEERYRDALRVDPGFGPARVNLGRLLFGRQAFEEAREQFLRLTQVAPSVVEGWTGLCEALMRLGRTHEADEILDDAREKLGERPQLVLLVARRLLRQGEVEAALAALAPITRESNDDMAAAAWAWTAVANAEKGDAHAARDAADRALRLDPQNRVASYARKATNQKKD